jgi:hypothetical protein
MHETLAACGSLAEMPSALCEDELETIEKVAQVVRSQGRLEKVLSKVNRD